VALTKKNKDNKAGANSCGENTCYIVKCNGENVQRNRFKIKLIYPCNFINNILLK